jgi:teichuronic acid biosynthesis glycosyltransferase TuaC
MPNRSRLHVLTLSTLFPNAARPNFGVFVERQTAALARQTDIDVSVINPIGMPVFPLNQLHRYKFLRDVPEHENWFGLNVYRPRFALLPKLGGCFNPAAIVKAIWPVVQKINVKQTVDIVDAEFFYPDGPTALEIANRLGVPFTIKARGSDIHYWSGRAGCRSQIINAAQQAIALLAVSDAMKSDIAALGICESKITVHYTGLDQNRFYPRDRAAAKTELGLTGPIILCVGALIARKSQNLLIEALVNMPGVNLILAGEGEAEHAYRMLANRLGVADRVQFLGSVAHDRLPILYAAADVMALVSSAEGLANAWVEALACGTPIIASNVGGAPELITSPDAGRIVSRTVPNISLALQDLLANPIVPAAVAAQARRFSWDENGRLLGELLLRSTGREI